jgi:hypothetical protein
MRKRLWMISGLLALSPLVSGCGSASSPQKEPAAGAPSGEGEPHEEDHKHAEGDPAAAPGDHPHESPHGGMVATSGDKHIELKIGKDGHVDVFVLDGEAKPRSSKGAQGKVKLTLPEGVKELPLSYDEKGDHLTAMAPPITAAKLIALVDLTIEGKPYSARFEYNF